MWLITLALLSYAPAFATTRIVIASGEFADLTSQKAPNGGYINHLIVEAFNTQGINVKVEYLPWKRNYHLSKLGKYSASSFWTCYRSHQVDFLCSEPIYSGNMYLYYLKSRPIGDWSTLRDLEGSVFGITLGYEYTEAFWQAVDSGVLTANVASTDEQNLGMLLKGRVDVVVSSPYAMDWMLKNHPDKTLSKLVIRHTKALFPFTTHLLFPKSLSSSKQLKQSFNKGLTEVKLSGQWDKYWHALLRGAYNHE